MRSTTRSTMRKLAGVMGALSLLTSVSVSALPSATAAVVPVKCAASDTTPDDRVFPEPNTSLTYLRFVDFQCGIELLASQYPDLVEITTLQDAEGNGSRSGLPLYDIVLTDETLPEGPKEHLLVMSSIHGNEMAGREGAARVIEDMVDSRFRGADPEIERLLDRFVVHFVFPNPDGWANGDLVGTPGAGTAFTRANDGARDLNRNFPVSGFLRAGNGTLDQPEGRALDALLRRYAGNWSYGTDNHGQSAKPVAASGLQIVGQFDYQKSEQLAIFADGIAEAMATYGVLDVLEVLNNATGGQIKPYEWGTLYDILGYSASGSGIDYFNTPDVVGGTGFATEMTLANIPNVGPVGASAATQFPILNQMWVNSVRAINYTMFRNALNPPEVHFPVGGRTAYVDDPEIVTHGDANGYGPGNEDPPASWTDATSGFRPYAVTRMRFFEDLNDYATSDLDAVRVPDVLSGAVNLGQYDSLVLADDPMPEGDAADRDAWMAALREFAAGGGNLVVTDGAAPILADLFDDLDASHISAAGADVGFADFTDRTLDLNRGLRGVASQTYDVIPIGYPDNAGEAPNWTVDQAAWEAGGGVTAGTNGTGRTIYGERALGDGKVRFLGALLPQPTEDFFHPYGLQNYAVTYTGYTLLENMLEHQRPTA